MAWLLLCCSAERLAPVVSGGETTNPARPRMLSGAVVAEAIGVPPPEDGLGAGMDTCARWPAAAVLMFLVSGSPAKGEKQGVQVGL